MKKEKIAIKNLAMALAFTNAAEMIRGHGEEGFSFDDKSLDSEYKKSTIKVHDKLQSLAKIHNSCYNNSGFNIDTSCS